jgi:hypothetical protein
MQRAQFQSFATLRVKNLEKESKDPTIVQNLSEKLSDRKLNRKVIMKL